MKTFLVLFVAGLLSCNADPETRPQPKAEPVSPAAPESSPSPEGPTALATEPRRAAIVQVEVDDTLPKAKIWRPSRNVGTIVDRMQDLVAEIGSGTYRSTTVLEAWAQNAKDHPGVGAGMAPLDLVPEVRVHYEPYLDNLVVENIEAVGFRPDPIVGPIDYGIGQAAAQTAALDVYDNLKTAGILNNKWSNAIQQSYSRRQSVLYDDEEDTFAWERLYVFVFRRFHQGFPVLDAKLEIGIGAHETPARTAYIRLGDVKVQSRPGPESADISTDDARDEFLIQADAAISPAPDSITITEEFVGYLLDPRDTLKNTFPSFHASFETLHGDTVAHGVGARLSLVEEWGVGYEWTKLYPWDGASPAPSTRPDGSMCIGPTQCQSGYCYLAGSFGGVCGGCASDDDCGASEVCDHPRPSLTGWDPSDCVAIATGAGCTNTGMCGSSGLHCQTLFYSSAFISVRTCSPCRKDIDCSSTQVCSPTIDLDTWIANFECIAVNSRALGELCTDDNECPVGTECMDAALGGLGTVGVCSECDDDGDCSGPETCTLPTASIFGTEGGVCE